MAKTKEEATVSMHNVETGEITTRAMNAEEIAQAVIDQANADAAKAAKAKAETDKAALLARLGLTEDELQTILG
jgi:hypothetical protein